MSRSRRSRSASKQSVFEFPSWGGRRARSGRKRESERTLVPHRQREALASRFPVHVTMRLRSGLASLRKTSARRALERALGAALGRFGTRIVQYSIQSNHVHLIVESRDERALARAMAGLAIRFAKALNRLWTRKGKVFADRYHERILRTPREVRNALVYVLKNHARHGIGMSGHDPFASGKWFDGWRDAPDVAGIAAHVSRARTWLLRIGWRRWGLVRLAEAPR